jgi:hypothetical protein
VKVDPDSTSSFSVRMRLRNFFFCLLREDVQALHDGQTGVDHRRQLRVNTTMSRFDFSAEARER